MITPALVGLSIKSCRSDKIALAAARVAALNVRPYLPVYHNRRCIGRAGGLQCAFTTLQNLESNMNAGQRWCQAFFKNNTSGAPLSTVWYDLWTENGDPAPAASPYSGTANVLRTFDDTAAGALLHGGNQSPAFKQVTHLVGSTGAGQIVLMLYDRVAAYDNCPFTNVLTNMTNGVTIQRYQTVGDGGLQIMCCIISGTGAGPVALSALTYNNDSNVSHTVPVTAGTVDVLPSRSGFAATFGSEVACPYSLTPALGLGPFLPLATGDMGVHSITSFQWSAIDGTNTCGFALVRPICYLVIPNAFVHYETDYVTGIANCEQIIDGAHLAFMVYNSPASNVQGWADFAWS